MTEILKLNIRRVFSISASSCCFKLHSSIHLNTFTAVPCTKIYNTIQAISTASCLHPNFGLELVYLVNRRNKSYTYVIQSYVYVLGT